MMSSRFTTSQTSAIRKSRLEGKPSYLPKPRLGSTDRLSVEARRPSNAARSSSAEPPRVTLSGVRLSREASATKIPLNRRSRSQQGESVRYGHGQAPMTPLRSSRPFSRPTTTPVRTPSEDRFSRSWQTSLDRALAFVTIKDQRPISNPQWQRSECHRVQEALASRGGGGGMALIRPLTITRFVDISGALLNCILRDTKLNNDNYVTKIPHIAKLVLYPGVVSKSWLKTVNTLHAFPHALAFLAYLLDLLNRIETPVVDEWLYVEKDELAAIRRDFLYKCWFRFQEPEHQFDDLDEDYLQKLKLLLGNDDEKIAELQEVIKKYKLCLEDEAEKAARAEESRRLERRAALLTSLRSTKAELVADRASVLAGRELARDLKNSIVQVEHDTERDNEELQAVRRELESQVMSVSERTRLLEEVDYAARVQDSKRALAHQISKMIFTKESELALWQKRTLDSCVQYKQGLIHLAGKFPHLADLALDENALMAPDSVEAAQRSVQSLRSEAAALSSRLAALERRRHTLRRARCATLDETRALILDIKSSISREQDFLSSEQTRQSNEAAAWSAEESDLNMKMELLRGKQDEYVKVDNELHYWEAQCDAWRSKLQELTAYVESLRQQYERALLSAKKRRTDLVCGTIHKCHEIVDACLQ